MTCVGGEVTCYAEHYAVSSTNDTALERSSNAVSFQSVLRKLSVTIQRCTISVGFMKLKLGFQLKNNATFQMLISITKCILCHHNAIRLRQHSSCIELRLRVKLHLRFSEKRGVMVLCFTQLLSAGS